MYLWSEIFFISLQFDACHLLLPPLPLFLSFIFCILFMQKLFYDRADAGRHLAASLLAYRDSDALLLAIPRGGVPVAYEVASLLKLPMEVLLVKKIGHPAQPEYAIGAAGIDTVYIDPGTDVSEAELTVVITQVKKRLLNMQTKWQSNKMPLSRKGRTVILIDDGIATGHTLKMAVQMVRTQAPKTIVVAVPVAPPEAIEKLSVVADSVICLHTATWFTGVGAFYTHFEEVSDERVTQLLQSAPA